MTTKNAMKGNGLELVANGSEATRFAEKAAKFLGKTAIGGPYQIIQIPEGARHMRTRSNEVLFYDRELPTNHTIPIREGARLMQFPDHEHHAFNTYYGKPIYDEEIESTARQSQSY